MAINTNFPNVRPSLLLDFANAQQLDPRVTFSRSTTAPYYDGKTSVLAEQNLTLYSQDWTQSVWTKTGLTATANSWVAPDGTTTGTLLTSTNSTAGSTGTYQNITFAIGSTVSFYAKSGTVNFIGATVGGVGCYANFNLGTGSVASSTGCTASMVSLGGGIYRCIIANTSISGTLIIVTGKDADPASSPWTNGVWTSGNTVNIWGFQVEQRSSVTAYNATTTTALTNYIPQLLTAPINSPRFDFNPTTGESLGLLIEQSSTNIRTYSQDFTNGVWTGNRYSITANTIIAPDGTQTASKLVESTATGAHYISTSATVTTSTAYTQSIYLKAGERTKVQFYSQMTGTLQSCIIDLTTGAISSNTFGTTPTMTSVGNNWWRFALTETSTSISSGSVLYVTLLDGSGSNSYTGNGYSGVFLWQGQIEPLNFATSPIATTSAQVTRASDNASMTGTNFSSWFNQGQGTMYGEAISPNNVINDSTPVGKGIFSLNDGTNANLMVLAYRGNQYLVLNNSATIISSAGIGSLTANTLFKTAAVYATNSNFVQARDGTVGTAVTTGIAPTINQAWIGRGYASFGIFSGWVKKIAYYPQALTSAQLQALTGT